jgi:hypothetical protein
MVSRVSSSRGERYLSNTISLAEIRLKYSNTKTTTTMPTSPHRRRRPSLPPHHDASTTSSSFSSSSTTVAATATAPTVAAPVLIALVNDFYFGDRYARAVPECTWKGEILPCEITADHARFNASDALA